MGHPPEPGVVYDRPMEPDLENRPVLVAGGTGGLGAAVVRRLAEDGARPVVLDQRLPGAGRAHPEATYHEVDVLDPAAIDALLERSVDGPPAVLVNVIGGYHAGEPVQELAGETLREQLDLNLMTAFGLTKAVLGRMDRDRPGRIVHVSSRVARDSGANAFAYSVSKLAVLRLVEAVAAELHGTRITINAILPSVIDTPANRAAMPQSDHDRWPKPHELADVIAFLVSERAQLISGAAIPVYGRA